MSFTQSPSVSVQTFDKTHYIPNFTNEVAAYVGFFEKGPVNKPIFITSIDQFKFIFGRGINEFHNDWYQVYNYLQYASGIWVCRTMGYTAFNASNFINVNIETKDEFDNVSKIFPNFHAIIVAKTPGEWGNLLKVSIIDKDAYDKNVEIYNGIKAKDVFTFFEDNYYGICVFRKDRLVEKFYKTFDEITTLNDESKYIFSKISLVHRADLNILTGREDLQEGGIYEILQRYIDIEDLQFLTGFSDLIQETGLKDLKEGDIQKLFNVSSKYEDLMETGHEDDLMAMDGIEDLMLDVEYEREDLMLGLGSYYGDMIIELTGGRSILPTENNLRESHEIFYNTEEYDIDIFIGNQISNNLAVELAEHRRDCMAFIGLPTEFMTILQHTHGEDTDNTVAYTLQGDILIFGRKRLKHRATPDQVQYVQDYIDTIQKSEFVHFTMHAKEQYDGFTEKNKLVNIAADTAGLKSQASLKSPWVVSAGLERGRLRNLNRTFFETPERIKNKFYKEGLNYLENGTLMSQKTYINKQSSFNRVHVRSLFNHVEKSTRKLLRNYVFDDNTRNLRAHIASELKQLLLGVKQNGGIESGRVEVKPGKENEILINVYIKPVYVAEYINLRMVNVGTNIISEIVTR